MYSALKQDGKSLYEYAREGKEPPREIVPRSVTIHKLQLVSFTRDHSFGTDAPIFGCRVECGGGTYIRSLIRDMGTSVNSVAHMVSLVRTRQADFSLSNALSFDSISLEAIQRALQ